SPAPIKARRRPAKRPRAPRPSRGTNPRSAATSHARAAQARNPRSAAAREAHSTSFEGVMFTPRDYDLHMHAFVSLLAACFLLLSASASRTRAQTNAPAQSDDKARGIELYQRGDNAGAVSALQAATKQHKDDPDAWYYLGLAYNRQSDVKQARKAFEHALKLRANFDAAEAGLAYTLLRANKFNDAERA